MPNEIREEIREENTDELRYPPAPFSTHAMHEVYPEPEMILDPSSVMEQEDRADGLGVDDVKTYHRTER